MNLQEREIWALIENYGAQLKEMRSLEESFGRKGGKARAQEIVQRLELLVKDLPG